MENRKIILETKGLSKHFDGIRAIDNIDMKLFEKEIIAIVGDNGAGKSTLIKTISGVHKRTRGEIFVYGEEAHINSPLDARNYGIETVYQEESVIPILDAPSNLFLGREVLKKNLLGRLFKFVDFNYMKKETKELLKKLRIELKDMEADVGELSGGQRQSISVGRAIYWGGKILILDEPTNNLGVEQEKRVTELIKGIRNDFNVSVIVISHNLAHIIDLVDRIIVLRNGNKVGEKIKVETNTNELVAMITGVPVDR